MPRCCCRGRSDSFDDFDIAQKYLKTVCFWALLWQKHSAFRPQSPSTVVCVLQGQIKSLPLTMKKADSGGTEEGREGGVHKCHLQLVWLLALSLQKPWSFSPLSLTCLLFQFLGGLNLNEEISEFLWFSGLGGPTGSANTSAMAFSHLLGEVNGSSSRDYLNLLNSQQAPCSSSLLHIVPSLLHLSAFVSWACFSLLYAPVVGMCPVPNIIATCPFTDVSCEVQ